MADKGFKQYERRIARQFGVHRTPLSGRNSRHTASDTLHAKLFIDTKVRREVRTLWRLFKAIEVLAAQEGKRPVLIVKVPRADDQDSVVACRLKDLKLAADSVKPEGGILDA